MGSRQGSRLRREIGIAYRALGLGQVGDGVVERRDVGFERRALEGAQTVPVKVKPQKTKLDTDALRGFDDL